LKLREEEGAAPHLIAYQRSDLPEQRESRYRIVRVDDAEELREALAAALGVLIVIAKERHLFAIEGVRIHLDRVDELGDFIEFEAVLEADGSSSLADLGELLSKLRRQFGIGEDDLLGGSYSDLALAHART
jgi:adenylate cyclase, class 2